MIVSSPLRTSHKATSSTACNTDTLLGCVRVRKLAYFVQKIIKLGAALPLTTLPLTPAATARENMLYDLSYV
jgi:hypothetical protein